DALKRVAYLKSYRNYREQQAANVVRTQQVLQQKITGLNVNRERKSMALVEENSEKKQLEVEKKEKDAVVRTLKSRENELNKELADKKKADAKLRNAIAAAIRRARDEAVREAAALAKKNTPATATTTEATAKKSNAGTAPAAIPKSSSGGRTVSVLDADPSAKALSDNFEKNRGSLPWPVTGSVSMHFGPQKYEGLGSITYNNQGITINSNPGAEVKAVFDGEVTAVFSIGAGQAVILKHGRYFTSYGNITASVSKGEKVKRGQALGRIGNEDMEFVITNESQNFDPEKWLR
ncbi:MAG: peptidoglycan DD-metalloendopeptidase family protein, partial [Gemmatimonadaceae bacterium]|nr:peptidoglycan DD-metalloendopeptidase family protein [Chitinophagaceae bacterium]